MSYRHRLVGGQKAILPGTGKKGISAGCTKCGRIIYLDHDDPLMASGLEVDGCSISDAPHIQAAIEAKEQQSKRAESGLNESLVLKRLQLLEQRVAILELAIVGARSSGIPWEVKP